MTSRKLYTGSTNPSGRLGQPGDLYTQVADGALLRVWVCVGNRTWR